MKTCVFGGGPGINIEKAAFIASDCDLVLAADGGADAAVRGGVIPSKVVGDLDSISQETMELLKQHDVPFTPVRRICRIPNYVFAKFQNQMRSYLCVRCPAGLTTPYVICCSH